MAVGARAAVSRLGERWPVATSPRPEVLQRRHLAVSASIIRIVLSSRTNIVLALLLPRLRGLAWRLTDKQFSRSFLRVCVAWRGVGRTNSAYSLREEDRSFLWGGRVKGVAVPVSPAFGSRGLGDPRGVPRLVRVPAREDSWGSLRRASCGILGVWHPPVPGPTVGPASGGFASVI